MRREYEMVAKVKQPLIKAYRPSVEGLEEPKYRVLIDSLRFLVMDKVHNWPNLLSMTILTLNLAHNRTIGDTSHYLVL